MKTLYTRLGFVEGDVLLSMNGIHQHLETVLGTSWNLSQPSNKQVQDSPSTFAKDIGNFAAALLHYAGIPIVPKKNWDILLMKDMRQNQLMWISSHFQKDFHVSQLDVLCIVHGEITLGLCLPQKCWYAGILRLYRIPIERVHESKRLIIALGFVFCSLSVEGRLRQAINHSLRTS